MRCRAYYFESGHARSWRDAIVFHWLTHPCAFPQEITPQNCCLLHAQIKVLEGRLVAAETLDADAAAAQEEAASLTARLAAQRAQLAAATQQRSFLQSIGMSGGAG